MVKEVISYETNNHVFLSLAEAEDFEYKYFSDIEVGDLVEPISGLFGRCGGRKGKACHIDKEEGKIYFISEGNAPDELIMSGGLKHGAFKIKFGGLEYSWEIGCLDRKRLVRIKNRRYELS
jgi:hypothetical protein